jgi:hypothetical protein
MSKSDSDDDSDIYEMTMVEYDKESEKNSDKDDDEDDEDNDEEDEDEEEKGDKKGDNKSKSDKSDSDEEDGDESYLEDEYEQVPTFKQFEHIGEANDLDIAAGFDLDPKNKRKMMANLTGEERFRKIANQYINENFKQTIRPSVIANLLENIKKIEYKNPKAFILAYYFIATGKKDKQLQSIIFEYIENEEMGVDIKDVVRYIRLIRNLSAV